MNRKVKGWQIYKLDDAIEMYKTALWEKTYYQDIPELDLNNSRRKNSVRVADLHLDKINFTNKIVWDIGCAGGFFLRYALDHGAKAAYGFDKQEIIEKIIPINNHLGYSISFRGVDLKKETEFSGAPSPDITFFLSMNYHIKTCPQRVLDESKLVIFEDNGKNKRTPNIIDSYWNKYFPIVEYIGRDSGKDGTTIYHLWKR